MSLHKIFITTILLYTFSCQSSSAVTATVNTPDATVIKKPRYERPKEVLSKEARLNIPYRSLDTSKIITTFAFGSCNDQKKDQPLWKLIRSRNPQLMLMMGDNVYASKPEDKPIIDQYIKLNENKDYVDLREAVPFLATWDDHDYGQNDGGADNSEKTEARKTFINYWSYLKNLLSKNQTGIYHSRIVGEKKNKVQFIMLDTRFDRSPLTKVEPPALPATGDTTPPARPRFYQPSTDIKAQILSESQWHWLEEELKKPAELRILVSSIQFVAEDHGFEKWANFPFEKKKLIILLEKLKIRNLIILSGDRHAASIAKLPLKKFDLYDITASGLNRPSPATEPEQDVLYTTPSYLPINFGLATIDWSKKQVEFSIIGEDNKPHLNQTIRF